MSSLDILSQLGDPLAARPGAGEIAIPIHDRVPGRIRWSVRSLKGNPALKVLLETGLLDLSGIHSAQASTETGNLLTRFDPGIPAARIGEWIAALVRGEIVPSAQVSASAEWHSEPASDVLAALDTSGSGGLSARIAKERLAEHGANALPPPLSRTGLSIFFSQFQSLPIAVLAVAGGFSLLAGGAVEAVAILSVLAFNGVLGAVVESRSERIIRSLGLTGQAPVLVVRDGAARPVPPERLVPGDIIPLRPGLTVPADARVISARDLRVGEAMLTGESLPVEKRAEPVLRNSPLAERASMVFRGTAVIGGSGEAVVVATGTRTEIGRIQRLAGDTGAPQTPLQRELDRLGGQLVWASLAACGAVMGVGALRGIALVQLLRSGVSLAVAAIPEGLPAVATTTLALGIEDMRKQGVLVRRLDAVESLASVGVVCFDKTGTLTLNQMHVTEIACEGRRLEAGPDGALADAAGQRLRVPAEPDADHPLEWLLRIGALCSDAGIEEGEGASGFTGSATEGALLRLAFDAGVDVTALRTVYPRLAAHHRSARQRFMLTAHGRPDADDTALLAVKGSPAEVLDLCAWELRDGAPEPLSPERRTAILHTNERMASDALRVLGFAFGSAAIDMVAGADVELAAAATGLTWVGLAGMADPVRPGAEALLRALQGAGLRTVMMTGDQVATARAVAARLGLSGGAPVEVFDVADLGGLDADALAASAKRAHVFARVSPAQKLHIIRALQAAGERVAMAGDGINDSPALKAADVGVAMGGTASSEAAREAGDVVLPTDDLAKLAVAVERGRATYVNVRKSIRYLLATNLSEILVVLGATSAGFGEPLTVMQLLWINLVSDVLPGLGLAFEPPEPGLMQRPPNAERDVVGHDALGQLAAEGGMIAGGSLVALAWGAARHGAGPEARTMAFGSLVAAQLLHALTARSDRDGLFAGRPGALPPNRPLASLLAASAAIQALGLLVPGLRRALGVVALGPADLAVSAVAGVLPYLANEALKAVRHALSAAQ